MKLLRSEFTKLVHQKRSYVGWGGLLAVPLLMTLALYLNRNDHHDNGPGGVVSLAAPRRPLHADRRHPRCSRPSCCRCWPRWSGSLPARRRSRDRHHQDLAHALHQPRRRARLQVGHRHDLRGVGLVLVFVGGLIGGGLAFGLHAPLLLSGQTVSVGHGLWLTLLSYLYVFVAVVCVLSLALLFATFTNSSLTAAIAALVVVIVMGILGAFSYFDFLKPYLFTSHIDAWQGLFSQPIDWHPIWTGLLTFAIYIAALMAAAWYLFRRKDILV